MLYAFDTETYLLSDNDKAPKPVVCSWSDEQGRSWLSLPGDDMTLSLWSTPQAHFVGHNISYDIGVMMRWHPECIPAIVQALDEGRVWDTQVREKLKHLAEVGGTGFPMRVSLSSLEKKYLGLDRSAQKQGTDIWRLKYGTLDGVPLDQWPADAVSYALEDAVGTMRVFQAQGGIHGSVSTEFLQVQASVCLHLMGVWGMRVNQENVRNIKEKVQKKMRDLEPHLEGMTGQGSQQRINSIILEAWAKFQRDEANAIAAARGVCIDWQYIDANCQGDLALYFKYVQQHLKMHHFPVFLHSIDPRKAHTVVDALCKDLPAIPLTTKGPKSGEDDIEPILPYAPLLKARVDYKHLEKMLSTYVIPYEGRDTIHPSFNAVVTTGRTSCSNPNVQNIPRGEGYRKNLHARPGYLLGTVDYSAIEMITFAATILRNNNGERSKLADAINNGEDIHCLTASGLFDTPYETIVAGVAEEKKQKKLEHPGPFPYSDWRQGSKALNFGGLGGLGPKAFQAYSKASYGVNWTLDECRKRIKKWKATWPEIGAYLDNNALLIESSPERLATATNNCCRTKAGCTYTQLCNYPFQSLAADGAKLALWQLAKYQLLGWIWTEAPQDMQHRAASFLPAQVAQSQYLYRGNALRRSHTANMVHDEIVCEHPVDLAEQAFELQKTIMVDAMQLVTQGIKVTVEGILGTEWEH
jgi:hypothetical protein